MEAPSTFKTTKNSTLVRNRLGDDSENAFSILQMVQTTIADVVTHSVLLDIFLFFTHSTWGVVLKRGGEGGGDPASLGILHVSMLEPLY